MLNILVNDSSFSTLNDGGKAVGGKKKKGKKSKSKNNKKNVAKQMGFTAEEILQMKEEEKNA